MIKFSFFLYRDDSMSIGQTSTTYTRQYPEVTIQPSRISSEEVQFIQNTLPIWLTEIEGKCASKYS